jgi:uncharacterized protein YcfJ
MRQFKTSKWITLSATAAVALTSAIGIATSAHAQEQGRVISSQPVIQQVAVPRQVCSNQQVVVEGQKSGAGGLMGFIGGAAMGDRIEGNAPAQVQNVQNCTTQTFYENRTSAYNVVYEFGGKQYQTQMASDPGQFVQLQVTPVGGAQQQQQQQPVQNMGIPAPVIQPQAVIQQAPVVVASPQVVYSQPQVVYQQPQVVYQQPQVVYQRPYYPVVYPSIHLGFGFHGGHGHRRWH